MHIVCTNCDKKYEISAEKIGEAGRKVQCSHCQYIWFAQKEHLITPPIKAQKTKNKPKAQKENKAKDQIEDHDTAQQESHTIHETIVKNLPVVIEQDVNEQIKEALLRSQNLNTRLSTMLFLTNFIILAIFAIIVAYLMLQY